MEIPNAFTIASLIFIVSQLASIATSVAAVRWHLVRVARCFWFCFSWCRLFFSIVSTKPFLCDRQNSCKIYLDNFCSRVVIISTFFSHFFRCFDRRLRCRRFNRNSSQIVTLQLCFCCLGRIFSCAFFPFLIIISVSFETVFFRFRWRCKRRDVNKVIAVDGKTINCAQWTDRRNYRAATDNLRTPATWLKTLSNKLTSAKEKKSINELPRNQLTASFVGPSVEYCFHWRPTTEIDFIQYNNVGKLNANFPLKQNINWIEQWLTCFAVTRAAAVDANWMQWKGHFEGEKV